MDKRAYMRERARKKRLSHRDWLNDVKAIRGCSICGEADHRCLTFHHRDPQHKRFQVTANTWSRRRDDVMAEIDKCDVLCANCRHRLHFRDSLDDLDTHTVNLGG